MLASIFIICQKRKPNESSYAEKLIITVWHLKKTTNQKNYKRYFNYEINVLQVFEFICNNF